VTQSTFDWPDLPFREGRPPRRNVIVCPLRPEHPLRKPQMPALSGLWVSRACYPVEPQRHWRAARPTGEMPQTNLCNRLVVTSTLGATPFPGFRLSPCDRREPPQASFWVGAQLSARSLPRRRWIAIAGSPALDRPRSWCCAGQLLPNHHPRRDRGVPRCSPGGRYRPSSSSMIRLADAPCRYPQPVPGIPSPSARARTRFLVPQPKGTSLRARGAFHQQVPPSSPELAPERRPHGPPLVPWLCRQRPSFRHAFTPLPEGH